jgi:hypothetical protein
MVRRMVVLSAVLLMVLAAGPAAWADNIAAAGDISQKVGGARNDQATARLIAPSSGNGIGLVLALVIPSMSAGKWRTTSARTI